MRSYASKWYDEGSSNFKTRIGYDPCLVIRAAIAEATQELHALEKSLTKVSYKTNEAANYLKILEQFDEVQKTLTNAKARFLAEKC